MAYNFTKEQVLEAIKGTQGIISKIQKKLENQAESRMSWHTAEKWVNRWEETRQAIKDEVNFVADLCDQAIYEAIVQKDMQTIKWYATMKMKDRGYDPSATLKLAGDNPLNIQFEGVSQEELLSADNVEIGGPDGEAD